MQHLRQRPLLTKILACLIIFLGLQSASVNAAMVGTETVIQEQQHQWQQDELLQALESEQLQQQLIDMGVDPDQVKERVQSLTPAEIAELNQHMDEHPAGSSALGILALIFIVFIITDAMCATNLFSFVNCVN